MVAQEWQIERLSQEASSHLHRRMENFTIKQPARTHQKRKTNKSDAIIETHAVDRIALACSEFIEYRITSLNILEVG